MNVDLRFAAIVVALAAAAGAAAADDSPRGPITVGVMTHFAHGWDVDLVPRLRMAGLTTVRDELYWNEVEPERGQFRFPERFERYMAALEGADISPMIALTFANNHYDAGQTPHTQAGFDGYARYATEVLRKFGDQVQAVEIWNEFNGTFCKGPATADRAAAYSGLLRTASSAIKARRPDVIIAGGATAGVPLPYFERLFATGSLDFMDAVSIHPYRTRRPPEGIEVEVGRLRDLIARFNGGKSKPIWVTEIGWNAGIPGFDEERQAAYLVRAMALLFSAGVERIYWYPFRDTRGFENMGLVFNDDRYTPKAAYFALIALRERLDGAVFVGRDSTRSDFYSLRFRKPDGVEERVIWSLKPTTVSFGPDSLVTNLLGESRAVVGDFEIGEFPVFVAGPVSDWPEPDAGVVVACSQRDFAAEQGAHGWSYGYRVGAEGRYETLPEWRATDWQTEWGGELRSLAISADGQHPAAQNGDPVEAVRRWRSERAALVRLAGEFRCDERTSGVGASIAVGGDRVWERTLGGSEPVAASFDFVSNVRAGDVIDFSVDPGPSANPDFDATETTITIREVPPPSQPNHHHE